MKIYFFSKKIIFFTVICSLLVGTALIFGINRDTTISSSNIQEPIYQGNTGEKVVAITVNVDWGEEYIPTMLDEFKKHNAIVTFFVTGKWAEKNGELLKLISKAGHSIQNHGYKHCHFNNLSADNAIKEIKKAEKIIYESCGQKSTFFASPYGEQNKILSKAVNDINYKFIMWSVDTIDWQRPSPDTIIKRVMTRVHNDAIILMHPTEPTIKALPELLTQLQENEYKMISIENIIDGKSEAGKNNDKNL